MEMEYPQKVDQSSSKFTIGGFFAYQLGATNFANDKNLASSVEKMTVKHVADRGVGGRALVLRLGVRSRPGVNPLAVRSL